MPFLSITIPTFNRPAKVLSMVQSLVSQWQDDIEIVVVDNCSDDIIENYMAEHAPDLPGYIRFHRNIANIGLAANICRCYEVAHGEWVWTVGDDDEILPDAITKILEFIRSQASQMDLIGINFSTSLYTYPETEIVDSLAAYWKRTSIPMAFSNALFLTSCVFRKDACLNYLRIAYQQTFSAAPHVGIPLAALLHGQRFAFSPQLIARLIPASNEDTWSHFSIFSGIPVLAEIPKDQTSIHGLTGPIAYFSPGLRIKNSIRMIFMDCERGPGFWYIYYSRMVPLTKGKLAITTMVLRFFAGLAFRIPLMRHLGTVILKSCGASIPSTLIGQNRI